MATNSEDLLCGPCESSRESKPAIRFCLDCDETLCETCADCHMKFKSTKGHKLVSCDEKGDYEGARMLSKSLMCPRHSDKIIEVRCEEHKDLCCFTCATIIHRKCNSITEVVSLGTGLKSTKQTNLLRKRIEHTKACIEEILKRNDGALKALESSVDNISETLKDIQASLARLYEALEQHIMKKVEECRTEVSGKTSARKDVWDGRLIDTKNLLKMFDTVLDVGSESQVYIAFETITAKLEEMKEQIEVIDGSGGIKEQVLDLEIKQELQTFLKADKVLSYVELKLSHGVWSQVPRIADCLTEDDSLNEANITSDFFRDELDSGQYDASDEHPGGYSESKISIKEEAKSAEIWNSSEDSDTDSAILYKQKTKYGRQKRGKIREKKAKMKNAKNYRHDEG